MKVVGTLLVLFTGIVAGVYLARYLPVADRPAVTPVPDRRPIAATTPDSPIAPAVVTLQATGGQGLQSLGSGTIVSDPGIVVAPIGLVAGATRLSVETANGQVAAIDAVLAADEVNGIVALRTATVLEAVDILQPDSAGGSLYLGRDVLVVSETGTQPAQVDSAVQRDELGAYFYSVHLGEHHDETAAAVIDPDTGLLLGLVRAKNGTAGLEVIDSEPVNLLIDRIASQRPRTLEQFTRHYFGETTAGQLALLKQFVASEQFDSAIALGQNILHLDTYTQAHATPLLRRAFEALTRQAIENREWRRALQLLGDAEKVIELDDTLLLLRAEAFQAVGELGRALDDLLAVRNPDDHRIRRMVIEQALNSGQGGGESGLSLLERALASDPDYAPYHRLLGEQLARRGDMHGALVRLERAIALDPAMEAELDPLLRRLRARRNTPPLTEVKIQRQRNTLFVGTRINGSNETFRFLVDTGASYTAITAETALRLGIRNIFFGAPVVELQTAGGRIYTTTATLDQIDVGGARVDNVEAVILESMSGLDGLLGQSFLRHFDVDIDRTRGVIAFNRRLDN